MTLETIKCEHTKACHKSKRFFKKIQNKTV